MHTQVHTLGKNQTGNKQTSQSPLPDSLSCLCSQDPAESPQASASAISSSSACPMLQWEDNFSSVSPHVPGAGSSISITTGSPVQPGRQDTKGLEVCHLNGTTPTAVRHAHLPLLTGDISMTCITGVFQVKISTPQAGLPPPSKGRETEAQSIIPPQDLLFIQGLRLEVGRLG